MTRRKSLPLYDRVPRTGRAGVRAFVCGDLHLNEVESVTGIPKTWLRTMRTGMRQNARLPWTWAARRLALYFQCEPIEVIEEAAACGVEYLRRLLELEDR